MGRMNKNKKIKEAVALRYLPDKNNAPEVVATGKGEIAEKIIEKAKESNVPVYEDESLAHELIRLKPGQEIPRELYEVVAEILVFISDMDRNYGQENARKE